MHKKNIIFKITTILFFTLICTHISAEGWNVPADKKAKNSFIKFDNATSKEGEVIYNKNCASCHGNPGKNNSLKTLNPVPPDLSSAGAQALTDGELFYILNTGRSLMPAFNNVLSETERWKVISYIRSFNNKYVQVLSKTDPAKSDLVKISIAYDEASHKLKVSVGANEKTGKVWLKDSEIFLFVNRYFGKLQIDKTQRTNNSGEVTFLFPEDLPGDKTGNLDLTVKVNDNVYGEIEFQNKLKAGIPTDMPSLRENRAMWNVMAKAPFWIIIAYLFGVTVVTAVLLYVIYNLYKLRKSSNK